MPTEKIVDAILRYKVDRGGIQQVVASNRQVSASIKASGSDIKSAYSQSVIGTFNRRLSLARGEIKGAAKEAQELERGLREASAAARQIDIPNSPRTSGGVDTSLRDSFDTRETAGERLGAVLGGLPGGSELANFAGLFADLNAAAKAALTAGTNLQTLAAAGGIAGAAVIAIALALQNFQAVTAEARAQLEAALVAQENYYDAVANLDEQGARDRIAELERGLAAQRRLAAEARTAADSAFTQLADTIGDAGAEVFFALDSTAQNLVANANEAEAGLSAVEQEIVRLNQGLAQGEFAANNATVAQEELAAATQQATAATLAAINARVDAEVQAAGQIRSASSESVRSLIDDNLLRIQTLQEEQQQLIDLAAAGNAAAQQALPEVNQQLEELALATGRLANEILPAVEAREKEASALQQATRVMQIYQQSLQRIAQLETQITDIRGTIRSQAAQDEERDLYASLDLQRRRHFENIDFQRSLAESEAEFLESRSALIQEGRDAETEAQAETNSIIQQANDEGLKRTREYLQQLDDIERDSRESILEGASNLDARAVLASIRQRDRQLQEAQRGYETDQQQRQDDTQQRLTELTQQRDQDAAARAQRLIDEQVAYDAQRQQAIAAFDERRQREDMENAIARQREETARGQRRAAQEAQIADLQNAIAQEGIIRRSGYAGAIADIQNMMNRMRSAISGASGGSNSASNNLAGFRDFANRNSGISQAALQNASRNISGRDHFKGMADGGIVPENTRVLAEFERGRSYKEAVIPLTPQGMRSAGMGNNITVQAPITITGIENADQIAPQLEPMIERVMANVYKKVAGG